MTKTEIAIRLTGKDISDLLDKDNMVQMEPLDGTPYKIVKCGIGFSATTDFICKVISQHHDNLLEEMLPLLPTLSTMKEFMGRMPTYEVDEETFEYMIKNEKGML